MHSFEAWISQTQIPCPSALMVTQHTLTYSRRAASAAYNANTIPRVKIYSNVTFLKSTDCSFPVKSHTMTDVGRKSRSRVGLKTASESSGLSVRRETREQSSCNSLHGESESCQRCAKRKQIVLLKAAGLFEKGLLTTQCFPATG